jgi:hypothetical protein
MRHLDLLDPTGTWLTVDPDSVEPAALGRVLLSALRSVGDSMVHA